MNGAIMYGQQHRVQLLLIIDNALMYNKGENCKTRLMTFDTWLWLTIEFVRDCFLWSVLNGVCVVLDNLMTTEQLQNIDLKPVSKIVGLNDY